jgi:hypothetical protein
MRIYLAGYYNGKASAYALSDEQYSYYLESYHYINTERHCAMIRKDKRTVFLDSGAFSMHTKGIEVDLDAYVDFVKTNHDILHLVSNLDHIGEGKEQETYANQKYLEGQGIKVQPVFHVRDRDEWLLRYLDEGYDYIFIGGMVPESTQYLQSRLDDLWGKYLIDGHGQARVRVHGFGLTVLPLMERYPWFSVDSTSWVLTGRFGSIYVRLPENGRVVKICISGKSPRLKDWDMHYDSLPPIVRKRFDRIFEEAGYTPAELRDIYWKRDLWNIAFFKDLCDRPPQPFTPELGVFDA